MRILHVADRLSTHGGAYVHMLAVIGELSHEHDVTLAVGRCEDGEPPCPVVVCPGLDARDDEPVSAWADLAASGGFDLVHVHNVMNPAVLRRAAQTGPAVVTVQDHRFFCPGRGKWHRDGTVCREAYSEPVCAACFDDEAYFREILSLTQARFEALRRLPVIVLSEYMRSELTQAGLDSRQVHVIPPLVDGLDGHAAPDGRPCVAFVGRLAEAKGAPDAIEAWRLSGIDLPLVFAGSGPLRADIEREGFEVTGWLDRARLSSLYRRAKAVLLPSRWQEPFGIVGVEAQAMGIPVVTWESGGVAEWHRGTRVAWGDVEGLAHALRAAVVRSAGATPGPDRRSMMDRLVRIYEEAMARTPAADL